MDKAEATAVLLETVRHLIALAFADAVNQKNDHLIEEARKLMLSYSEAAHVLMNEVR